MERKLSLKAFDGQQIDCIWNTSKTKNNTVIVFVHGLTGSPDEHLYYNAAKLFPAEGIDVFRMALYGYGADKRSLEECSITTHGQDIDRVVAYLRPKYRTIVLAGHSLGCPSILKSDYTQADLLVFWEPSHLTPDRLKRIKTTTLDRRKVFVREGAYSFLMSKAMIKEWGMFDGEQELSQYASLKKPLFIAAAKKGVLLEGCKRYYEVAEEPKKLRIFDNATHSFVEEGIAEMLYEETIDWIKMQIK